MHARKPSLAALCDFPCHFPIKVIGKSQAGFTVAIQALLKQFDAGFDTARIKMRTSRYANYIGLTCTVRAQSQAHLDQIYCALTAHPMVSAVL